ncbi:CHY zinc finger protein [Oceanobacillus damuensis]|uniref:CHY zinc finger protein n=1 Tax=Oceanobacillus damuensis TaxID=937928 RepID=UPI0008373F00|nr:CHY zinc finger protein [Oceanobacillus damuensis]
MSVHGIQVKGAIDSETRCKHYHQENDRIAIKFYCCGEYFPCFKCHAEEGCGSKDVVWPQSKFSEAAILCGACGKELTIEQYLNSSFKCPVCQEAFNPGCRFHHDLYFEKQRQV